MKHLCPLALAFSLVTLLECLTIRNVTLSQLNFTGIVIHSINSTFFTVEINQTRSVKALDGLFGLTDTLSTTQTSMIALTPSSSEPLSDVNSDRFIFYGITLVGGLIVCIMLAGFCIFLFYIQFSNCR